ncbi:hypothetical protein GGX14DRAFT_404452 [Mycena pura]|uniref:Uncharacterized protein n=1 Tax=Mycena pura TaxID=153505 RepID=A0AAD6Y014_9AGAR|nr:hypothetical protein GGX14DRAFT_404452 [Mycena pura]
MIVGRCNGAKHVEYCRHKVGASSHVAITYRTVEKAPVLRRTRLGVNGEIGTMLDVITLIKHGLDRISIARGGALYRKHRKTREHDTVRHAGRVTNPQASDEKPSVGDEQRTGGSTGDVDVGEEASVRLGVWADVHPRCWQNPHGWRGNAQWDVRTRLVVNVGHVAMHCAQIWEEEEASAQRRCSEANYADMRVKQYTSRAGSSLKYTGKRKIIVNVGEGGKHKDPKTGGDSAREVVRNAAVTLNGTERAAAPRRQRRQWQGHVGAKALALDEVHAAAKASAGATEGPRSGQDRESRRMHEAALAGDMHLRKSGLGWVGANTAPRSGADGTSQASDA